MISDFIINQMGDRRRSKHPQVPDYWIVLSDEDKTLYYGLRKRLQPLSLRTARDELATRFHLILSEIKQYSMQHNSDDWRRCLICGIAWLDGESLAISTRQLCKLIGKCKSSVNAGFQSLGYSISPMTSQNTSQLMSIFPFLAQGYKQVRQWTMRTHMATLRPATASEQIFGPQTENDLLGHSLDAYEPVMGLFQDQDLSSPESDDPVIDPSEHADYFGYSSSLS
jgi:hypothetical protein